MKHYTFGGSTAKRTLACPAWVNIAAKGPQIDRTSVAAARGTNMHAVMEVAFDTNTSVLEALTTFEGHAFTEFDIDQMVIAEKAVRELFVRFDVKDYAVEPTFEMNEHVGGSTDIIATGPDVCLVIDFKFGRNAVNVERNPQLAFYHMLAGLTPDYGDMVNNKRFIGAIIQPAISYEAQIYEYSIVEVEDFGINMMFAIDKALRGETRPTPGDHCEWCPAVPYCSAKLNEAGAVISGALNPAHDLAASLAMLEPLRLFIAAVEAEAYYVMSQTREVPGWKLVAKKKLRKWASEKTALEALKAAGFVEEDILTPGELKSPAQLDKVLKKSSIEFDVVSLLDTSEPGVTLAPENDPRAKVTVTKVN